MLEGLVAWVLNNYLGKYVENLNTDQLSVAMLSGKVELENLPLKKDALRHLGIPIQVKAGFIGKVKLQVPVRQIRSAPWVIVIERLYLVAAPVNLDEWDSELEATIEQERKVAILDALEAQWRAENEAHLDSSYYGASYSSWLSYGTGLLTNIVENLQLKLNDVHIRYEDAITCGERHAFACGLTVESLSAESCDTNWQKGFTVFSTEGEGCSFKLIELQKLAVYWDPVPMPTGLLSNYTLTELAVAMSQTWNSNHHYIVAPSTAIANVKRERCEQPLRSKARPRINCNLTLDQVLLNLTDRQYNEFVGCLRGLDLIARWKAFRHWRPHVPVAADARAWWRYAIKCHYPDYHWMDPAPTWDSCGKRARKSCEYVNICLGVLTNPTATLPPDKKAAKDEFEWNTPLELLKPLRQVAIRKVPKAITVATTPESNATGRSMLVAWFPQWWGWYGSPPSSQDSDSYQPATENTVTQSVLEEEILDVLADSIENNTLLKRDTVFGHFNFTLNRGCLNLSVVNSDGDADKVESNAMLELQFEKVCLGVESRPRTGSHAVTIALGAVCLRDKITQDTLFPVLIAPQGTIREGLSSMNVTSNIMSWYRSHQPSANSNTGQPPPVTATDPLFQLTYERKPFNSNCDYKLYVKSQSLEVVYNSGSVKWLSEFILKPFSTTNGNNLPPVPITGAYAHVRDTTKMHIMNKWEDLLQGNLNERSSWQIELDVSAPQIMFVEDFIDKNGIVMVVDFGKMHLTNGAMDVELPQESLTEEDDMEMFMTPCSTPPGSVLSPASPLPLDAQPVPPVPAPLDQQTLHRRLYDRYKIELSDLQFLVGRARDNWKYAHTKGTSSLHLLDRFSISLQAERRVVYTSDPQFPSATLCGTLPHLVVHLNEQKLAAVRSILTQITTTPTTQQSLSDIPVERWLVSPPSDDPVSEFSETEHTERSSNQLSKLFMLQFAIDQMALEVQSRGRSIAEVQVCGVRAAFTKRPFDYSLSLSVHSLLLVDALQTYGPDFELLVASHKHVGMDCASGSMRDSEPTSPTSPASPDGRFPPSVPQLPPPQALAQALHSLHTTAAPQKVTAPSCVSPVMPLNVPGLVDSEALIVVEVTVVCANCPSSQEEELRIANILFNNLDIIANQETIVELIGFAQRVLAPKGTKRVPSEPFLKQTERLTSSSVLSIAPLNDDVDTIVRTEITFDFHRLSVLLLRAAVQDGDVVAKKIATATMSEAKIQATIGSEALEVKGSLGGLQVVSLCPGTSVHTRIVSVGQDSLQPVLDQNSRFLSALAEELYRGVSTASLTSSDEKALVFSVKRTVETLENEVGETIKASVCVHMASVWYTHSGLFLGELQSCVIEFKQYLSNLARSIKAAAADMAIGLVQSRPDSLYANPKLSQSTEGVSPRRRTHSMGYSLDNDSVVDFLKSEKVILSVDVELETPVVVLPRSAASTEVFVAHLGKMFLNNRPISPGDHAHHYQVQVRDITLFSLDIGQRLKNYNISADNMQSIYNAGSEGKPVLHNTTLQLSLQHSDVLSEKSDMYEPTTQVTGKIVTPLRVSATREQFEQLLDTVKTLGVAHVAQTTPSQNHMDKETTTTDSAGVTTLRLDPQLRAQVLSIPPPTKVQSHGSLVNFKGNFQLPSFTVELRGDFGNGERSLVDLSFRDFNVNYEKCHRHETSIQVSLHSITMEDLTQDIESKHRLMMVSHTPHIPKAVFVSKSCPDFITEYPYDEMSSVSSLHLLKANRYSMPSHLNVRDLTATGEKSKRSKCGVTPPSSPYFDEEESIQDPLNEMSADDNLVLISVHLRDPDHPLFEEKYSRVSKFTKVDFNCLNLVVSIDSWVAVLDFFGIVSDESSNVHQEDVTSELEEKLTHIEADQSTGITETEMSIRSLSVVLLGHRGEVCRANISRLGLQIWGDPAQCKKSVEGSLGSMSLTDLTQHGKIWRERFLTSAKEALNFHYKRLSPEEAAQAAWDTTLSIDMSSVSYVHTKRFVAETQAFFRDFSLLQRVLVQARQKVSVASKLRSNRMHLSIECRSPLILVPVSSSSKAVLVIDLGRLKLDNSFKLAGTQGTISTIKDSTDPVREMLDVRIIQLDNMDLFCGERRNEPLHSCPAVYALPLGRHTHILKRGPSLLTENCRLVLQMENNMETYHNVPDMTIQGTLDTLECALDLDQYKLIRGLLSFNMGEDISDLNVPTELANTPSAAALSTDKTWTLTSIKLDLLNVTVKLETEHKVSSLACINFIKSRLLVEVYSDLSQDIDLVSQEILVSDTRYQREPANKRSNVFTSIVQPMSDAGDTRHSVQAEVHARKRRDHSAYTILVNNMRLMAIMDWWEAVNQFILHPPDPDFDTRKPLFIYEPRDEASERPSREAEHTDDNQIELKLNITESQVVLVEDTSLWDTNAVILKSTTVISYKPGSEVKPVSCVLNHCEVFSCVLGMEDETALSIIDPVTLHIDLDALNVLQFQVGMLNVRLSYHDMRMFAGMLQSLPAQARVAGGGGATHNLKATTSRSMVPANSGYFNEAARRLSALGFSTRDCATALALSSGRMDEAALWLTQNAKTVATPVTPPNAKKKSALWPLNALQLRADCITLCVIDDCLDSDVPLLEFSFSELTVNQDLRESGSPTSDPILVTTPQSPPLMSPETELAREARERQSGPGGGKLKCVFSGDYYNRSLSGWEPVVEPWRCEASWEYTLTSSLNRNRLQLEVNSTEILNINITSTLVDLYTLVKTNWTQDYYALTPKGESSPKNSPVGYRRRSPFVPFALNNQTGHKLWFTTFVTSSDVINEGDELSEIDDTWMVVRPGETEAFSFGSRRRRGRMAGLRLHQIGVRVDGWGAIGPVCVDRVGVYFRHATHTKTDVEARVVFAVTLEGSARKLVTVRSALQLINDLPQAIDVRIDSSSSSGSQWGLLSSRTVQVASGQTWSAPLVPSGLPLWVRPLVTGAKYPFLYCAQPLDWRLAARRASTQTPLLIHHVCHSSGDQLYRLCCIIRREKFPIDRGLPVPGHTLILKPALRIVNLLPVDLHHSINSTIGAIAPGATVPFHQVNVEESIEMSFKLDGFANSTVLTVAPTATASFSTKVKMIDGKGRRLYLNAHISIKRSDTIKVLISAPYWIVNRTGIPIVFRQEGIASETAGQYEEHEIARMVAPLLFSFAESEGSPTVVARVGSSVPGQSQWCSSFGLGPGTLVRRLVVRNAGEARGERVVLVGVSVRAGRGRYRCTNICTICPRYQLHNNTSYHLQFAQKCLATNLSDPGASATYLSAISGCYMPFHWPRPDKDQLLCVRPLDAPDCNWSGGFHIDTNNSLHISCRDAYGAYYFLRLEVVLQGATFFVVFTDADTMPPAIRLENFSPVSIIFHQAGCKEEVMLKPHTHTAWALSEPCGAGALVLGAPGGGRASVELQLPSDTHTLTYMNYIYVAFSGTHASTLSSGIRTATSVEDSQLVLEVPTGTTKVILGKKRYGDRSQLWRRGPNHQLIHEGSSPPQATSLSGWEEAPLLPHALVLDIEGPAPRPDKATPLALRRPDPRRISTQTWRIVPPGRMCCAHANLCLQPEDGFFSLRPGSRVVLGLPGPPSPRVTTAGLPIEQAVSWQTLRPGSGLLDISVYADGPTRVIKIVDAKDPDKGWLDGNTIERNRGKAKVDSEFELRVALGGLAVSVVSRSLSEELVYALFSGILMELANSARSKSLNLSVQDVQCDNQLLGTTNPVLLHVTRPRGGNAPPSLPAVHLSLDLTPSPPTRKYNAVIFKHFIISFRPISVRVEEKLLLKLCMWGGLGLEDNTTEELDENDFETHRMLNEVTAVHAKRYYFGVIKIVPSQIRLSMQTTSKLSAELSAVKRHLNLTLIKFEDAGVELEPFIRWHPFETGQFLWHLIIKHFKDELKWQAAKILGSVDFLGNPLGFVQDVSEGFSGLIYEGNVGALVKNVTHGFSNSAAKVTESLGDGLERVVVDEAHEETRRRIRSTAGSHSGSSHLVAGFRGLGLGLLGGVTSLVKHSYEGAAQEGIQGFFTGVGKGLVGTVTKPVIGVLDLATETASALRETSRRSDKWVPERMRPTRCPAGAGGLLPRFSRTQSIGHQYLYSINHNDYSEGFLAYECVRDTPLDIRALLSTHYLRIFTCKGSTPQIVMETHLSNLVSCVAVCIDNCHFVEMGVRGGGGGAEGPGLRRPRVQCDSAELAEWVARQAAYAKRMYHERQHTLHPYSYV